MPQFTEDPALLSKSKLKSALIAHCVELPPAKSKKEVYVELHVKNIVQKNAADFSSDEEEQVEVPDVAEKEEEAKTPDPSGLTDDDLKAALFQHGVVAGPIVASTRAIYERKLKKLLESDGPEHLNGNDKAVLYSDSEEEEDEEEGSEGAEEETDELSKQDQQESSQNGAFNYPQCFLPPARMYSPASRKEETSSKRNLRNALKSSERSQSQIPVGISWPSSEDQRPGLGSGGPCGSQLLDDNKICPSTSSQPFSITQLVEQMEIRGLPSEKELNGSGVQEHWSRVDRPHMTTVGKNTMTNQTLYSPEAPRYKWKTKIPREPEKPTFDDLFQSTVTTPTGIMATCRRPIKGAAGRPIEYAFPDTPPISPATLERREVERRLVPIHIQILALLFVAILLFLIYGCVEENSFSPFLALLDSLEQEDRLSQDTPVLSGQE